MFPTRVYKNMTNCLDTAGDFSSVITLVNSLKSRKPEPSQLQTYNRYDQEVFQDTSSSAFQIKRGMTFNGVTLTELASIRTDKPVAAPSRTILNRKRRCPFESTEVKRKKRTPKTPIIIVPAVGSAMISVLNAMDILQEFKFVSPEERKGCSTRLENDVLIMRRKDGNTTVPYRIVSNPAKLTPEEWERVVAVFVQGRAWQFKGWQWNADPTKIFSKVCAFHIKYDDAKTDPNVAKWNCDVLSLSKTKRHLDKAVFHKMWQKIEHFIRKNKPTLRS